MKKKQLVACFLIAAIALTGCNLNSQTNTTTEANTSSEVSTTVEEATTEEATTAESADVVRCEGSVIKDEEFGGTYLGVNSEGFRNAGFIYGDSCDMTFSNGYVIEDVPFHSGYYCRTNAPVIADYQGYEYVCFSFCSGDSSWEKSGCQEGDTVTVTLRERGKYLAIEQAMSMVYSDIREEFTTDDEFANFRVMNLGNLKENTFYRGASPVNNCHNRAPYVDSLLEQNKIGFVLDLADNQDKLDGYQKDEGFASDYYMSLYNDGKVALLGLNAAYQSEGFKAKLVKGLNEMSKADGPYYIHCTEGKDRTGFVCILIEAIGGCTYDEILDDYMYTYYNYFKITKETKPEAYTAVDEMRYQDMLFYLTDTDSVEAAKSADLVACAKKYLLSGGMTDEEFSQLQAICVK